MDFEKIRPAVEEISLSDSQKEEILNVCRGKKRKFNYKPLAAVAAAAAIIIAVFSPGFLFRAKSEDNAAPQEAYDAEDAFDIYYNIADKEISANSAASAQGTSDFPLFEAEGFEDIYAVVPAEFSRLVSIEEYKSWSITVTADGGMAAMQFAGHFGITRADFDAANEAYAARTGDYLNADIIYTFDKNAVDEIYKLR